MPTVAQDAVDELRLLATILERLLGTSTTGNVRNDQLEPLSRRLRGVVKTMETAAKATTPENTQVSPRKHLPEKAHSSVPQRQGGDSSTPRKPKSEVAGSRNFRSGCEDSAQPGAAMTAARPPRKTVVEAADLSGPQGAFQRGVRPTKKESSVYALPVARVTPPSSSLLVSKEVVRVFTCTLYNVLESTAIALEAARISIFVKVNDEMVSVGNVAPKLTFPPKLNRHRCQDSIDAEVLGSGIAVNQRIDDATAQSNSLLVFPVYPGGGYRTGRHTPIATVHAEHKTGGKKHFDTVDETFLFFASVIIGELMSRVPLDWLENFFDPATQHVLAPFEPYRRSALPLLKIPVGARRVDDEHAGADAGKMEELVTRIDGFAEEILVRRESLPHHLNKAVVGGLSVAPSLREVRNYVENVQDSWKRNVNSNVELMEEERETQGEVKVIRRELARTQQRLLACEEQLRLYQLEGTDYKQEYRDIKKELDVYIRSRDDVLM